MSITNGYLTLAEFKRRYRDAATYTAATLSFAASGNVLADTAQGLARFRTDRRIQVSGSGSNNGYFTVAAGGTPAQLVTTESLINESAGASVTLTDVTDPAADGTIEQVIEGVSREIDNVCNRHFYAATETRYFTPRSRDEILTPDLLTVTTLKTDEDGDRVYETTWAATDYDLNPENAPYLVPPSPYHWITRAPRGRYYFRLEVRSVEIAGTWGGSASVPAPVREACAIQTLRLFKREDAPFGVLGSAEMGQVMVIPKLDPDVIKLLEKYIHPGFA